MRGPVGVTVWRGGHRLATDLDSLVQIIWHASPLIPLLVGEAEVVQVNRSFGVVVGRSGHRLMADLDGLVQITQHTRPLEPTAIGEAEVRWPSRMRRQLETRLDY